MLKIEGLRPLHFGPYDISLDDGEAVALMGPSGAGKTVLLRAIADLDPAAGAVALDGADRLSMPAPQWRRRVTYLAAEPAWWEDRAGDHFPDTDAAAPWLERLDLAADKLADPVARLSTGERKRLALARVLVGGPRVMLLDEPTSGLDEKRTEKAEAVVRNFLKGGGSVLFTTHDPDQASRLGRRCLEISDGRLGEGPP